jgi:hypothetical protein
MATLAISPFPVQGRSILEKTVAHDLKPQKEKKRNTRRRIGWLKKITKQILHLSNSSWAIVIDCKFPPIEGIFRIN